MRVTKILVVMIFTVFLITGCSSFASDNLVIDKGNKVPVLMYHHLVTKKDIEKNPKLAENGSIISAEKFKEQMKYLHDNGYNTVSIKELQKFYENEDKKVPPKTVVITFDDGYKSNYTYAYPVLKKYKQKALINIIVKYSNIPNNGYIPHLSWEEMREMQKSGLITFGSHTYNQHHYRVINKNGDKEPALTSRIWLKDKNRKETPQEYKTRIRTDLKKAKKIMEEKLHSEVDILCFPYGAYNNEVLNIAEELGHEYFLTIKEGYNTKKEDLGELKRYGISEKTVKNEFIRIVKGEK